ncbi:proline-rich protein 36-like isoform X1 [Hemicordylus capensis]|uniref:proline-rich protein 36-like isoform X1 n=1 Tax=Hemicordylus capensis TaxID=884348 RepID=UPI002302204E|nr:proline-rich protein 36-like isoform X1 [Hemicordylus capensis]
MSPQPLALFALLSPACPPGRQSKQQGKLQRAPFLPASRLIGGWAGLPGRPPCRPQWSLNWSRLAGRPQARKAGRRQGGRVAPTALCSRPSAQPSICQVFLRTPALSPLLLSPPHSLPPHPTSPLCSTLPLPVSPSLPLTEKTSPAAPSPPLPDLSTVVVEPQETPSTTSSSTSSSTSKEEVIVVEFFSDLQDQATEKGGPENPSPVPTPASPTHRPQSLPPHPTSPLCTHLTIPVSPSIPLLLTEDTSPPVRSHPIPDLSTDLSTLVFQPQETPSTTSEEEEVIISSIFFNDFLGQYMEPQETPSTTSASTVST